ncbi:hypothetical protein MOJ79_12640 [Calidifontimicrobium sp. SYSU G02091]|uniref:hypothetical protein n=1 Tax=Calidifontimicrobium sp. SYSU G02091 TaxID=2926421 RepID=UPI001F52FDB2|nr:hypothetical protein [Calidifontimicrobium sp. SYSU G02091]MCI1192691.1 hypothetical protein [Calidifontimicrobium sp. SYSU G02091]
MHLVVPFAAPLSDAGRQALRDVELPHLAELLSARRRERRDDGDAWSLTPPHERALARAWGWAAAEGALPFAAHTAAQAGIEPGDLAWGLLTPVHLHLGTEQVSLLDPQALQLDEATSRTLFDAVAPLFTSEGFVLRWVAPLVWLTAHESLRALPTASLDRVIGRHVDRWLPDAPAARLLRRLQNEVQMLLYTHPVNAERESQGRLSVNSVWLSGCGPYQPARPAPALVVDERLRAAALAEDWPAWQAAWRALDAGPLAAALDATRRGEPVTLTLCGERSAVTFDAAARRPWARWFVRRADAAALLETL